MIQMRMADKFEEQSWKTQYRSEQDTVPRKLSISHEEYKIAMKLTVICVHVVFGLGNAFDKVDQTMLLNALYRLNMPKCQPTIPSKKH